MQERRRHFRSPIALPVEVALLGNGSERVLSTSSNVSAGGIYLLCQAEKLHQGDRIGLRLKVPPAPGRSSRLTSVDIGATVLRVEPVGGEGETDRQGIACRFHSAPRFN